MTALTYETPSHPPELPFADQRGGMKAMGVILIVLGAFLTCITAGLVPLMLLPMYLGGAGAGASQMTVVGQPGVLDVAIGLLMYVTFGVVLITVGVGSFRLRRWSRAAALILTGSWAIIGLLSLIVFAVMIPATRRMMTVVSMASTTMPAGPGGPAPAGAPPAVVAKAQMIGLAFGLGFVFLFGVALPAGLFLFFRRRPVQQTLDYFSPGLGWTDRCPTPVLAASAWMALGAVMLLTMSARGVVPAFGVLLHGPNGIAVLVLLALVNAVLAVALYRVRPAAWWATLLLTVVGLASVLITFSRVDPLEMHRLSGVPQEQLELMQQAGMNTKLTTILPSVLFAPVALAYLLWIRRYFRHPTVQPA